MAIDLVPLCTIHFQVRPPIHVGTGPAGTRMVIETASAQVKGDRLNAELLGTAGADWTLIGPEGTGTVDARETLRTDDGAVIYVQFSGRLDASQGLKFPMTVIAAPRFETGDERYAWLNRIQAIGKGIFHEDLSLDFEWYEVR
jgi:Protein of unknown function (DUF3237)